MHNLKILFTVYLLNRTNALHDKMSQIQEFRIEEEKSIIHQNAILRIGHHLAMHAQDISN